MTSSPKVEYNPQYNPFQQTTSDIKNSHQVSQQWEKLYEGLGEGELQNAPKNLFDDTQELDYGEIESSVETSHEIIDEKSPSHYQYKGKYIMTAVKSGLMIIDQHRAHIRILFDMYLEQLKEKKIESQKVLFPEVVQFCASDQVMLQHILPELQEMGFELTDLGGNSYAVNAVPTGLDGIKIMNLVSDMVQAAIEKGATVKEEICKSLALSLARYAAIPQGQVLSNSEMENIVNQLFACNNVNYTPDGKNILCILKQQEIEHLLG
jgi:DNA mismatch repair protein MutL